MFLIKSFEKHLFLEIVPNKWEQKHRPPGAYHISIDYANVMKFIKITLKFNTEQAENTKSQKTPQKMQTFIKSYGTK